MCTTCGCGQGSPTSHSHEHHGDGQHTSARHHHHEHDGESNRWVKIEQEILGKNNRYAEENRRYFGERGIFALNLTSSPGAGKTTLLEATIRRLREREPIYVIEGDQQTRHDADRIHAAGAPALQINTGKACHLDAHGIGHAVADLAPAEESLLFIENVGNLVCPAAFDLGEAHKVTILSVTEGDDKPVKYPDMFHASSLMLINKIDLLPYVHFDVDRCIDYARSVRPDIEVILLSATGGDGMDAWLNWLDAGLCAARRKRNEAGAAAS